MKIKTIDIQAKEWFDKTGGNSYFSGRVILNYGTKTEKVLLMPFQYGYNEHYLTVASDLLDSVLPDQKDLLFELRRLQHTKQNKIILRYNMQKNCLLRDVKNFAKV
jgi:hypothetical protein